MRKRLNRRPNFNAHEAFTVIDWRKNGYITKEEFRSMLAENQVYVTDLEMQILVARYDKGNKGKISYSEFVEEFVPRS